MSGFLQSTNELLSIILKTIVIIVIVIAVFYFGLSIYGNIVEPGVAKVPTIDKAEYIVHIKTTGQRLFTNDYSVVKDGHYVVHGYYELKSNKWRWIDTDIPLDEEYFGPIEITRRSK